jgi:SAM-dependent methyltransferase
MVEPAHAEPRDGLAGTVTRMLGRLAQWSDSTELGRRMRRVLLEVPITARAISALDRRRVRRLERDGDLRERSKLRWRTAPPGPGLTWGTELSGDPVVEAAEARGVFGRGRTVLEVGPGYGRVLRSCLARGVDFERYIGLDVSEQNVRHLRRAFADPRIEILHGDAESAALAAPVDAVLSFLTFKHLYPSFQGALENLGPQVRAGGIVMFDLIEGARTYFHRDRATFIREYTRPEVGEILGRTSLDLVEFDEIEHAPGRTRMLVVARKPER